VRLGVNPNALLECLHLEALGVPVLLRVWLVTLGGCRHLDSLVQWGSSSGGRCLSSALIVVIVRGSWPFSDGEPKDTLVDCSWLVWSSACIGCAAPYWGFGVWCQLAREPLSEWIVTMRTSLPVSKWTSVKKSLCHHLIPRWLVFIVIHSLWLIGSIGDWLILLHGGITLHLSRVFTFLV
jgi:hypothetical protein